MTEREAGFENRLITPYELSLRLGLSEETLRRWRRRGHGPTALILSPRVVRYDPKEVEAWIRETGFTHPKDIDWSTTA